MLLIELSANKTSFKTVRFNKSGLSLIVGKKTNPEDHSREHSTNGVGKSLLLFLVNFCLGAKKNIELTDKLPGWEFYLDFELVGVSHRVTRSTLDQNTLILDGNEISLTAFHEQMGKQLFSLDRRVKYLTYRSLVRQFFRQGKHGYLEFNNTTKSEQLYTRSIRTAYLLGLDEALVNKKRELREEEVRLKNIQKQFRKDQLLKEYFHGNRDVAIELRELDELIASLEKKSKEFKVAENYEWVEQEAEAIRREWRQSRNELHGLENSLKQIENSVGEQPDLSVEHVAAMYEEASVKFSTGVLKKLKEVFEFHESLVESRNQRLAKEKHRIQDLIDCRKADIERLDQKKDEHNKYLGSHGALIEYEALLTRLADNKRTADRLREFQQLMEKIEERKQKVDLEMAQENIRTNEYLKASSNLIETLNERYRGMARRIWPLNTSGLSILNDSGDNQIRFNIEPRIQSDNSDGIGESKIFCFDMTVLHSGKNHKMKTIMHDNRLFPEIDPRQRAEVFRIAHALSLQHDCQYIASLNEENLKALEPEMSPEEYNELMIKNTVLELTDDTDEGKLLGITIDLKYQK